MPKTVRRRSYLATKLIVLGLLVFLVGCRTRVPIHVWHPPNITVERNALIAIAPISGPSQIATSLDSAMFAQRPAARGDIAILTSDQLTAASPIRLASTAVLSNDLMALQAAKAAGADIVLCGQILEQKLDWSEDQPPPAKETNMNNVFFQRLGANGKQKEHDFYLLMSWSALSTHTGQVLGTEQMKIRSSDIPNRFPDLQSMSGQPNQQLIAACAREAWKTVTPKVEKDQVRLASPWFQPGSWRVLRGVRAAKKGQWPIAEQYWQSAADGWLPSPAAHHNLAIAKAAREDFSEAKKELQNATGPLSLRLPAETLVWLDHYHKQYTKAHQLPPPEEGWSFEPPELPEGLSASVHTVDVAQLPWWSDIPMAQRLQVLTKGSNR
jgi:hypothetical protein